MSRKMSDFLQISWSCKSRFFPVAIVVLRNRGTMALLWALKNCQNLVINYLIFWFPSGAKISEYLSKVSVFEFEAKSLKNCNLFLSIDLKSRFSWNL